MNMESWLNVGTCSTTYNGIFVWAYGYWRIYVQANFPSWHKHFLNYCVGAKLIYSKRE